MFPVLLVNFIGALGFSIVLPFLVFLVTRFGGNPVVYGIVGAAYPAFQLVGAPVLGRWSDRLGRRRILLLSQAGTMVAWIVFAVALAVPRHVLGVSDSAWLGEFELTLPLLLVFLARVLDGLTGGNISVANAYVADITTEEERGQAFGKMGVSANLGFVFGPAIAALLGAWSMGELLPVLTALGISVVGTLVILFVLKEAPRCPNFANPEAASIRRAVGQEARDCVPSAGSEGVTFAEAWRQPRVGLLLVVYFLVFLGFSLYYAAFPVHAAGPVGWTVTETGTFFAFLSVMMALVQGPLLGFVSKRVAAPVLIVSGAVLLAVSFLAYAFADTDVALFACAVLLATGNGLMWPSVLAELSTAAGERLQGAVQGFAGSMGGLAGCVGLIAGGFLYEQWAGRAFAVSAALLLIGAVLALPLLRGQARVRAAAA